ncbi:MAG: F0F1 ATP synthase subunit epsilon [Bacteroidales bacterium]|nr:F0F1 ATP synthase subunit epsilon [Bacteroidales bacterium]MDD3891641.1 F0F1 ATP synthase subunit epsilon [Bacteroidales bacterium]
MSLKLEIVTPNKVFFSDRVDWVRVPGSNGSFAMLNRHLPIISTLEPGLIKIVQQSNERYFEITEKAIVEQHDNHVTIIATAIEEAHPIFVR